MAPTHPDPASSSQPTTLSLEALFVAHADFIFRTCCQLGLERAAAEDATQQVFLIASKKIHAIPESKERAFLFATARNIVANTRRTIRRRREEFTEVDTVDPACGPEQIVDRARARELADRVLEEMDLDLRVAFVLFEVEELTFTEIAELIEIPRGTVASRVRRAREEFDARVERLLARSKRGAQ